MALEDKTSHDLIVSHYGHEDNQNNMVNNSHYLGSDQPHDSSAMTGSTSDRKPIRRTVMMKGSDMQKG